MFSLVAAVVPHGAPRSDFFNLTSKHNLNFVMSTEVDNVIAFLNSVSFKEDVNAKIPSSANDQNALVPVNECNGSDSKVQNPIVSDADSVPSDENRDVTLKNSRVDTTSLSEVKKEVLEPAPLHGEPRNIFDGVKTEPFDRPLLDPSERDITLTMDSDEAERILINSGANGSSHHIGHVSQVVVKNIPFRRKVQKEIRQYTNSQDFGVFVDSTDFNEFAPEPKVKEEVSPLPSSVQVNLRSIGRPLTEIDIFQDVNDEPILTVDERDIDATVEVDDMLVGILKIVRLEPFDKSLINPDETEVDLMDNSDDADEDCGDSVEQTVPTNKKATPKGASGAVIRDSSNKFVCGVCKKSYVNLGNLKRHSLVHCRGRPLRCEVCGNAFFQKSHLNGHMHTHTEEKPHRRDAGQKSFECDLCEMRFPSRSSMKTHLRMHNGVKSH